VGEGEDEGVWVWVRARVAMRRTEGMLPTRCGMALSVSVPLSWLCVSVSEPKPRSEPSFISSSACSHLRRAGARICGRG